MTQSETENDESLNEDNTLARLITILSEVKKLHAEKDSLNEEIQSLKSSNCILTVAHQQRFLESLDAEKRACNLIATGVSENDDIAFGDDTASTDEEKVSLILNKTGHDKANITSIQRLGQRREGINNRNRPLKVILDNPQV